MSLVKCVHCCVWVMPMADGRCPGCQRNLAGSSEPMPSPEPRNSDSPQDAKENASGGASAGGLPWGFVAGAAAIFFLLSNKEKLGGEGAFIYIIGAIVLAVLSANMFSRR